MLFVGKVAENPLPGRRPGNPYLRQVAGIVVTVVASQHQDSLSAGGRCHRIDVPRAALERASALLVLKFAPGIEDVIERHALINLEIIKAAVIAGRAEIIVHHHVHGSILQGRHRSGRKGRTFHRAAVLAVVALVGRAVSGSFETAVVPLVEDQLRVIITILLHPAAYQVRLHEINRRLRPVFVPGHEIYGHFVFPHILEELGEIGLYALDPAIGGATDLEVREAFFQMLCSDRVKLMELLDGTSPCARLCLPAAGTLVQVGFVPNLPVLYIVMETVGPAFVVMADNVLADAGPFLIVLRRIDIVLCGNLVLDGLAKTVERLASRLDQSLDIEVGFTEIVGRLFVRILAEIGKDVADIDHVLSIVAFAGIVGAAVRDIQYPEIRFLHVIVPCRTVIDGIHGLYGALYYGRINLHIHAHGGYVRLGVLGLQKSWDKQCDEK